MVVANTTILAETGDSWFNGMALKLPGGARFEIEMQWGHIGWSVPAAFGYALGAPDRQVSLTDPDARSMATSGRGTGMVGYNVQTAV